MKQVFFILLTVNGVACARSLQETFLEGNKLYYDQQYKKALERYEQIQPKGPAITYNIGNTFYRLDDKARAIVAWKRAQKNAPIHLIERAQSNIAATDAELGIYDDSLSSYLQYRLSLISTLLLQLLFLAGWYLFFMLLLIKFPYRVILLSLVMLSNTIILGAIGLKYYADKQMQAIVVDNTLTMRAGPDIQFHGIDSVSYAHIVTIKKDIPDWYKIKYNGTIGWVSQKSVEII